MVIKQFVIFNLTTKTGIDNWLYVIALIHVLVDVFIWPHTLINPSLTVKINIKAMHGNSCYSRSLSSIFTAFCVWVVAGEPLGLCECFRAGNSGGRRTKHHLWTVSQDPSVSENHGLSHHPPRPRRAAQSGKHWGQRQDTVHSFYNVSIVSPLHNWPIQLINSMWLKMKEHTERGQQSWVAFHRWTLLLSY